MTALSSRASVLIVVPIFCVVQRAAILRLSLTKVRQGKHGKGTLR